MNRLQQSINIIDVVTQKMEETDEDRQERLEEARIENLEYEEECGMSDREQGYYDSGMRESDFY